MTQVREATVGDIAAILPLVSDYWRFEEISGFDAEGAGAQLERLLTDTRLGAGWIALEGEAVVGYLLAAYVFSLEHLGMTAEIDEFYVAPSQRRSGIGAELLKVAEAEFARIGCTNVSLQLGRDNDSARTFYLRHGYSERVGFELLDKMLSHD